MPIQWMTQRTEMEALLHRAQVGYLGTVGAGGQPYVVPLTFVYYQGRVYFHTAPIGRKMDNMRANPQVCFAVHQVSRMVHSKKACGCALRYSSVLVFGHARVVEDSREKIAVLTALTAKYVGEGTCEPPAVEDVAATGVVGIMIEEMTGKRNVDSQVR